MFSCAEMAFRLTSEGRGAQDPPGEAGCLYPGRKLGMEIQLASSFVDMICYQY